MTIFNNYVSLPEGIAFLDKKSAYLLYFWIFWGEATEAISYWVFCHQLRKLT